LDTYSQENIDRIRLIAIKTRLKYGAMEWGVTPLDLIEKAGLHHEEYDLADKSIFGRIKDTVKNITEKIRAVLFVKEKAIVIDSDLHNAKKPFANSHEFGHDQIPEHREILYVCSEVDLNPETRREMEFEANEFAAELLCPSPLMKKIYENYPLSMETILFLKDASKASITSAAIKYTRDCPSECCLLILAQNKEDGVCNGVKIQRPPILSRSWYEKYKRRFFFNNELFAANHFLSISAINSEIAQVRKGELIDKATGLTFKCEVVFNGYDSLALIYT